MKRIDVVISTQPAFLAGYTNKMEKKNGFSEYLAKFNPDDKSEGAAIRRHEPIIRRVCMVLGVIVGLGVMSLFGGGVVVVMYFAALGGILSEAICYDLKWETVVVLILISTLVAWIAYWAGMK